jgi:hypothetical protein
VEADDVRAVERRGGHAEVHVGLEERGAVAHAQRLDRKLRARAAVPRPVNRAVRAVAEDAYLLEFRDTFDDRAG